MLIETVKVKNHLDDTITVNKEDAHLYAEFNKPKKAPTKKKTAKKAK